MTETRRCPYCAAAMESDWIFCCECGREVEGNGETVEDINEKDSKQIENDEVKVAECTDSIEEMQSEDVEEISQVDIDDSNQLEEKELNKPAASQEENSEDAEDDDAADIDYMIDKAVDCVSASNKSVPKHAKEMVDLTDGQKEKDSSSDSDGKSVLRRHSLSTGILIIWFVAVAIICLMIGGFGGATWQRGSDERAFDVERTALNEKIATLESKAEEDQKELAELREFRGKLEELVMEYMVEDTTASRNALDSNTNANTSVNGNTSNNVTENDNKTNNEGGPGSFLDFLFGGGTSNNENTTNTNTTNGTTSGNVNANAGDNNAAPEK